MVSFIILSHCGIEGPFQAMITSWSRCLRGWFRFGGKRCFKTLPMDGGLTGNKLQHNESSLESHQTVLECSWNPTRCAEIQFHHPSKDKGEDWRRLRKVQIWVDRILLLIDSSRKVVYQQAAKKLNCSMAQRANVSGPWIDANGVRGLRLVRIEMLRANLFSSSSRRRRLVKLGMTVSMNLVRFLRVDEIGSSDWEGTWCGGKS